MVARLTTTIKKNREITTSEAQELFRVTRATISAWEKKGVLVKLRYGVFDLKKSLHNYVSYRDCLRRGQTIDDWFMLEADREWQEAHPQTDWAAIDPADIELVPLTTIDAPMQTFEVEVDDRGIVTRVIRELDADKETSAPCLIRLRLPSRLSATRRPGPIPRALRSMGRTRWPARLLASWLRRRRLRRGRVGGPGWRGAGPTQTLGRRGGDAEWPRSSLEGSTRSPRRSPRSS